MANKFICEWCSGGFRTESGLAWHIERSHSVQAPPQETTTLQSEDEGEAPTTINDEESIPTDHEEQLVTESPEPTPEGKRAELEEIINAVVGSKFSNLRLELNDSISTAISKTTVKAHDEKRIETKRWEEKETEVNEQLKMLAEAIERNDRITATLAGICFELHTQPGDDTALNEQVQNKLNSRKRAVIRASLGSYFLDSSFGQHIHNHHRRIPFPVRKKI